MTVTMKDMSYNERDCSILNTPASAGGISYNMKNDKSFGLIDDLSIDHNGNQISSVSDAVDESLDYEGAFDFADGDDKNIEYAYNGNGALTMDLNKGIDNIEYELLGNPIKLTIDNNTKRIEYVYAADGRRLKTKHSYITYVTKPRLQWETNYPNKKSPTYFFYHPESKKFYEYNNQYQAIPVEGLSKEEYVNR